jgi:hypothetical protein
MLVEPPVDHLGPSFNVRNIGELSVSQNLPRSGGSLQKSLNQRLFETRLATRESPDGRRSPSPRTRICGRTPTTAPAELPGSWRRRVSALLRTHCGLRAKFKALTRA